MQTKRAEFKGRAARYVENEASQFQYNLSRLLLRYWRETKNYFVREVMPWGCDCTKALEISTETSTYVAETEQRLGVCTANHTCCSRVEVFPT